MPPMQFSQDDDGMAMPKARRFAGVLATNHGRIVLVRESYPAWGGSFWNIPSGMVEAHETPAEGAARELAEEAGVDVVAAQLHLVSTSSVRLDGGRVLAWNFAAAVNDASLEVRDPDDLAPDANPVVTHRPTDGDQRHTS